MFFRKERQIERDIGRYLGHMEQCLATFEAGFAAYLEEGLTPAFDRFVKTAHVHEHAADEKRREIEETMYAKALIPESRGDIMELLEALDLVANQAEGVLDQVWTEQVRIPPELHADLKVLVAANAEAGRALAGAVRELFRNVRAVPEAAAGVYTKEREGDHVERILVKAVFRSPADTGTKLHLRDVINEIGAVSDFAENAADRVRIIAVKRVS